MVDRMDREIGRVLDQVKAMGALDNTVIFFLSDNGASAETAGPRRWPRSARRARVRRHRSSASGRAGPAPPTPRSAGTRSGSHEGGISHAVDRALAEGHRRTRRTATGCRPRCGSHAHAAGTCRRTDAGSPSRSPAAAGPKSCAGLRERSRWPGSENRTGVLSSREQPSPAGRRLEDRFHSHRRKRMVSCTTSPPIGLKASTWRTNTRNDFGI